MIHEGSWWIHKLHWMDMVDGDQISVVSRLSIHTWSVPHHPGTWPYCELQHPYSSLNATVVWRTLPHSLFWGSKLPRISQSWALMGIQCFIRVKACPHMGQLVVSMVLARVYALPERLPAHANTVCCMIWANDHSLNCLVSIFLRHLVDFLRITLGIGFLRKAFALIWGLFHGDICL